MFKNKLHGETYLHFSNFKTLSNAGKSKTVEESYHDIVEDVEHVS